MKRRAAAAKRPAAVSVSGSVPRKTPSAAKKRPAAAAKKRPTANSAIPQIGTVVPETLVSQGATAPKPTKDVVYWQLVEAPDSRWRHHSTQKHGCKSYFSD